jgi:hypothetical protein
LESLSELDRSTHLTVTKVNLAHSGAAIGAGNTDAEDPVHPEIPRSLPSILQQAESNVFSGALETVDVVLLDGGINDVGLSRLLHPGISSQDLASAVREHCFTNMLILLNRVTARFTNARVVVSGYYQIVSEQTDILAAERLLIGVGVIMGGEWADIPGSIIGGGVAAIVTPFIMGKLVENSRTFAEESRRQLRAAVQAANEQLVQRGESARIVFAGSSTFVVGNNFCERWRLIRQSGQRSARRWDAASPNGRRSTRPTRKALTLVNQTPGQCLIDQIAVPQDTNEEAAVAAHLPKMDLAGVLVIGDAAHTTQANCRLLTQRRLNR